MNGLRYTSPAGIQFSIASRTTGPEGRRTGYKPPRRPAALVLPRPPSQSLGGLPLMEGQGAAHVRDLSLRRRRVVGIAARASRGDTTKRRGIARKAVELGAQRRVLKSGGILDSRERDSRRRASDAHTLFWPLCRPAYDRLCGQSPAPLTRPLPAKRRGEEAAGAIVATRKLGIGTASSPFPVEPAALGPPLPASLRGEVR